MNHKKRYIIDYNLVYLPPPPPPLPDCLTATGAPRPRTRLPEDPDLLAPQQALDARLPRERGGGGRG